MTAEELALWKQAAEKNPNIRWAARVLALVADVERLRKARCTGSDSACPTRTDEPHCPHWFSAEPCCDCGDNS